MNESSNHDIEGNSLIYQERVLIEDYRGPLNASAIGSTLATLPQNVSLASLRWPDEPLAADTSPTAVAEQRQPSSIDVFSAYYHDDALDYAVSGLVWSFAIIPTIIGGVFVMGILGSLLTLLMRINWSVTPPLVGDLLLFSPVLIPVVISMKSIILALSNLRRSFQPHKVLLFSFAGVALTALLLWLISLFISYMISMD